MLEAFLNASEKLRYPHIVPILGFRVDNEGPDLVQPRYIPMEQWLEHHHETELNERLRWVRYALFQLMPTFIFTYLVLKLREAADGLQHIHEARLGAIPFHGQVHLNNILLRPIPGGRLVAAIGDAYHLRMARQAYRVIHDVTGPLSEDQYPSSLDKRRIYITPELLKDEAWDGSQSEDVCTFGLSILHVSMFISFQRNIIQAYAG